MASSFTPNKSYELPNTGEQDGTWGITLNSNDFTVIDLNFGGRLSKSVAGSSNVTITDAEARNFQHTLTGTLTGSIDYIVPNKGSFYSIYNNSSGAFTITVKPAGGTGLVVEQGTRAFLFANPDTGAMEQVQTLNSSTYLLLTGGTMSGNIAFAGSYKLTGLAAGTTSGDSVRFEQLQGLSAITPTSGAFVVGNGTAFAGQSGSTARDSLGLGTANSPQFTAIELGNASDTTLSRSSAGVVAVEGVVLLRASQNLSDVSSASTARSNLSAAVKGQWEGINAQVASYTAVLTDAGYLVTMSNGSANQFTIPPNSSVAFPVNTVISIQQIGAGVTTVKGGTGVTLNGVSTGGGAITARYGAVTITKIATDTWLMAGSHGTVA
jgi:hypothetical protein